MSGSISTVHLELTSIREDIHRIKRGEYMVGGANTEARMARLEATAEHILREIGDVKADAREIKKDARSDFRLLFGAVIAVALGLAGLMAKGFHWL